MKQNVGGIDRMLRGVAGAGILAWGLMTGNWWGLVGGVLLFTALVSVCPAYPLLGLSTKKDQQEG